MDPAPDLELKPACVGANWGPWLAGTWIGIVVLSAMATWLAWDDVLLALDVVRHFR